LKSREEAIQKVLEEAHKSLSKIAKTPAYKDLLKKLIVQVSENKRRITK
jgi:vacuolar-type H+-ATPase subunit E/Vma4